MAVDSWSWRFPRKCLEQAALEPYQFAREKHIKAETSVITQHSIPQWKFLTEIDHLQSANHHGGKHDGNATRCPLLDNDQAKEERDDVVERNRTFGSGATAFPRRLSPLGFCCRVDDDQREVEPLVLSPAQELTSGFLLSGKNELRVRHGRRSGGGVAFDYLHEVHTIF